MTFFGFIVRDRRTIFVKLAVEMKLVINLARMALITFASPILGQGLNGAEVCGVDTYWDFTKGECLCSNSNNNNSDDDEDPNVISLAGIFDTTTYDWGPDVFAVTAQLLNQGEWNVLPSGMRLDYKLENANCDETTAARSYWKLRTENGNKPMHGIIGARCSGASVTLARLSGLESVPQLSPASNSAQLSDEEEFPFFSRMVAPNDENGEGR